MSSDVIAASLLLLRSTIFLTGLPAWLKNDAQLTSPLTSYTRLREGVFLFQNNLDPYAGGVFRQSPLMLALFSTVIPLTPILSAIAWSLCDGFSVWCLLRISRMRHQKRDTQQEILIIVAYLYHPYTALPSFALSSSSLDNTLHIFSLYLASKRKAAPALLVLAILITTSLPSMLLAPPIILLSLRGPVSSLAWPNMPPLRWKLIWPLVIQFILFLGFVTALSSAIAGGFRWITRSWGAVITLPDLTPNPGLWWYFFTEMFDHFRPFFLTVFSAHLLIYVGPITLKFQHDPLFASFILQGVIGTFKSYPTLSDPGLFTSMMTLFPEIIPHLRHPLPTVMLHIHAASLLPLFHHIWIGAGTGNANFFYASTLVFGLANGAGIIDALRAGLRMGFGDRGISWKLVQA